MNTRGARKQSPGFTIGGGKLLLHDYQSKNERLITCEYFLGEGGAHQKGAGISQELAYRPI